MSRLKEGRAIGLWALALVGTLAILTVVINLPWFDEELHPDLARLVPPQPVAMEGNAFPYIFGFVAANDRDPHAAGVEIIETLRGRYLAGEPPTLSRDEIDVILGNPPDENWMQVYSTWSSSCDRRRQRDCTERLIAAVATADVNDERLAVLLNRFDTLLAFDRFDENIERDASTPFPSLREVMAVSSIRLATALDDQPTDLVLDRIQAHIRFWKMMVRDGDSLLSTMLALSGLRISMDFLPALMRARDLSPDELARIAGVLTPLSDDERDIGGAFVGEAGYVMRSFLASRNTPGVVASLWRLTLQENATMNDYYAMATMPIRQRAALTASEHYRQLGETQERYAMSLFPPPLYNFGGKYINRSMVPMHDAMSTYISRVHDIDGRIALVLLQAEILANPDVPIERVVRRSQHRNPYTLEPMDYDAASGVIGFECLGTRSEVCAVEIGRD